MKWGLFFVGSIGLFFALVLRTWTHDTQEGAYQLVGLQESVTVDWDSHHIPWVKAHSWQDAYLLQGYLSARDRFFQMDLTRRKLAGRLSEVFGERALPSDIQYRSWNFSKAAELAVSA
ncbi:penicillin acylase family protein, partial [bacterium]|nr:penicillin acylase family protein [bacterium]